MEKTLQILYKAMSEKKKKKWKTETRVSDGSDSSSSSSSSSCASSSASGSEDEVKLLSYPSTVVASSSPIMPTPKSGILVTASREPDSQRKKSVTFAVGISPTKDLFVGLISPPPPKKRRHKVKVKHHRKAERSVFPPPPPPPPGKPKSQATVVVGTLPSTVDPYQQMQMVQQLQSQYTMGQIPCPTNPQASGYCVPLAYTGNYPLYAATPQHIPPQYPYPPPNPQVYVNQLMQFPYPPPGYQISQHPLGQCQ